MSRIVLILSLVVMQIFGGAIEGESAEVVGSGKWVSVQADLPDLLEAGKEYSIRVNLGVTPYGDEIGTAGWPCKIKLIFEERYAFNLYKNITEDIIETSIGELVNSLTYYISIYSAEDNLINKLKRDRNKYRIKVIAWPITPVPMFGKDKFYTNEVYIKRK